MRGRDSLPAAHTQEATGMTAHDEALAIVVTVFPKARIVADTTHPTTKEEHA